MDELEKFRGVLTEIADYADPVELWNDYNGDTAVPVTLARKALGRPYDEWLLEDEPTRTTSTPS